jgi:alkanesulfonate monooxygenase SsuD/methylene tetrahydromethanopterin reductase-like flavin-dependent oxidoreductase (luciferase family)
MSKRMPAVALAAVAGRRKQTLELAGEIERRGFTGIYCASFGDGMGLCQALATATERIHFGTAIANIYTRHPTDYAQSTAFIHELSGGRFRFGIGVSHRPVTSRLKVDTGKPLSDTRSFVDAWRATPHTGEQPPLVLAALRQKMVALGGEIADGIVYANVARSHLKQSLSALPDARRNDPEFFVGNMIPTCISDDSAAAAARNRKTLTGYVSLPNYRNVWKEAGYVEEMDAIEQAIEAGEGKRTPELKSERWIADCTLFGTAAEVREGLEAFYDAGVTDPILVPSSAAGNQMKAFEELFASF